MTEKAKAPGHGKPLLFIFITVALNSIGIGLIMPVMPDLLLELAPSVEDATIGAAAWWGAWLTAAYAVMQFLMSPTLGNLSDAYGRRPVMLISLLVMGVDYLIMAISPTMALLFVARIIAGAASATFSTANAFVADITPPEKRAQNFGLIGAAFGVGFVLGPAIGGLLGEFGARAPFWAAAALTFANLLFGWFVLPETLRPEKRRPFRLKRSNPIGAGFQMVRRPAVAWMLVALFIYNISHYVYPVVWSYYTKEKFDWTPADIGLSLALVGIGFAVMQGFLIRRIIPRFGEVKTALAGFAADVIALVAVALVTESWMVYALIPLTSFSALVSPAVQGLMSRRVPDDEQGELQGAYSSLASLSFIITPLIMGPLFFAFSDRTEAFYFPGAPFLAAACFSALAILPFVVGQRR